LKDLLGFAAVANFLEVLAETLDNTIVSLLGEFSFDFVEGEVNDVVMVDLAARHFLAQFEPDFVQEADFLRREIGSVRAEVENLFVA